MLTGAPGTASVAPGQTREDATTGSRELDAAYMGAALDEARRALDEGEVPVGAVVVHRGRIIGRGHNQTEATLDATAHAEIIAIGAACRELRVPRLTQASIYVTMEPCPMCAGAIVMARLSRVVYGCADPEAGYCGSKGDLAGDSGLGHRVAVTSGVRADECSALLESFFRDLRARGNAERPRGPRTTVG